MSHFVYYNNSSNPINGEPVVPVHYYNYMQSIWKNGQHMWYGGDGVSAATGAVVDLEANFMFGGDTDPYFYGTGGVPTESWTERQTHQRIVGSSCLPAPSLWRRAPATTSPWPRSGLGTNLEAG